MCAICGKAKCTCVSRKRGRPSKRTPERETAILNALRVGNTRTAASAFAEVDRSTFMRWLDIPTFRAAVEKAEADAETRFLGQVARAAQDPKTWTAAAWWLERRKYQDYARRDKVEMTIDVRKEAERLASELGLDPAEVLAEAEAIMRGGR
jgi:hypothetical protein